MILLVERHAAEQLHWFLAIEKNLSLIVRAGRILPLQNPVRGAIFRTASSAGGIGLEDLQPENKITNRAFVSGASMG